MFEREFIIKNNKLPDLQSSYEDGINSSPLSINDAGGCTANVGLIKGGCVYVANAGDSRSVACTKTKETIPLSFDHKPENIVERQRIENAGGYVDMNRVMGNLALSRAFGDFTYKVNGQLKSSQQMVIADPDVSSTQLESLH